MPRSPRSRSAPSLLVLAAALVIPACGRDERVVDVGAAGPAVEPVPVAPPGTSPAERLGVRRDPSRAPLDWTAPGEWTELPAARMRTVGYQVGGDPNAECTLAVYPGASGGVLANVNRWRKQMSLEPIDEAALAALPTKPLLRGAATWIELSGRYVGMGGDKKLDDAKLLGLVRTLPASSVFVKLVGPASVVNAEASRFEAFCASIRMPGMPAEGSADASAPEVGEPAEHPPIAPSTPAAAGAPVKAGSRGEAGGLRWVWPAGWSPSATERPMRAATLVVEGAPGTDVALTILPGDAGGLAANLNRWRGQMGQPALSDAEIAALPRVASLGTKAVVVSIAGTFESMSGGKTDGATFVGAVIERESDVVFVKVTGPTAEVDKVRPGFDAFLASLEPAGGGK